jgi:hypothetical protein
VAVGDNTRNTIATVAKRPPVAPSIPGQIFPTVRCYTRRTHNQKRIESIMINNNNVKVEIDIDSILILDILVIHSFPSSAKSVKF